MCMCICMGTKTISIMDDAYDLLNRNKSKNESFSDVIRKLATTKKDIMRFAGILNISSDEAEEIKGIIENLRKGGSKRTIERIRGL